MDTDEARFEQELDIYTAFLNSALDFNNVAPQCYGWVCLNHKSPAFNFWLGSFASNHTMKPKGLLLEYISDARPLASLVDDGYVNIHTVGAVLWSLNVIHSAHVLHGDLEYRNCLITKDGEAVWLDFSEGKHYPDPLVTSSALCREAHDLWERFCYVLVGGPA